MKYKYFSEEMTPHEARLRLFDLADKVTDLEELKEEYRSIVDVIVPKYIEKNRNKMTAY